MELEQDITGKAEVLIEALPYIQRLNREIIVVEYDSSAMVDEELRKHVAQDVVLSKPAGFKPIIIHDGGKEISKWVNKVGMEPDSVNGLRVAGELIMEIAETVLNEANKSLVQTVNELGIPTVGISGKDGMMLKCGKKHSRGEDIGFVGGIKEASSKIIYDLLEKDFLPIICLIGYNGNYLNYNVNADSAACATAMAAQAEKLTSLADVEDVYRDFEDKDPLISRTMVKEAQEFVSGDSLGGGMLLELQNCIGAIKGGVSRVHILGNQIPHYLLLEIFANKGVGTAIINVREEEFYYEK